MGLRYNPESFQFKNKNEKIKIDDFIRNIIQYVTKKTPEIHKMISEVKEWKTNSGASFVKIFGKNEIVPIWASYKNKNIRQSKIINDVLKNIA